ncbi:hypothetical protein GE09DRAFT_1060499 [Coniochaeta sp. 2T2.1]|nr:hypothetical protein GE09DRAFT_1060499 [Coniochaeta sp. 2T2.1]
MPGSTITQQYPLYLSFDTSPYQNNNEQYAQFSPPLSSPLDIDEFGTDFTTDSAPSPGSPSFSPALTGSYALPEGDWNPWDKIEGLQGLNFPKTEPFEETILSSIPPRSMSLSPAINPMALTNPPVDDVLFGREGINDNQPLFQTQPPLSTSRPQLSTSQLPVQQSQQQQQPSTIKKPSQPPTLQNKRYLRNTNNSSLKRKSSTSEEEDDHLSQRSSASPPPANRRSSSKPQQSSPPSTGSTGPKKTAHNMIEKRYRNNLNDKIAALRDSVPALRVMVHRLEGGAAENNGGSELDDEENNGFGVAVGKIEGGAEDLGGLAPAHKLNKATILGKATEYIVHLEKRNRRLAQENETLRSRVEGFEMLVMSRGGGNGMWA